MSLAKISSVTALTAMSLLLAGLTGCSSTLQAGNSVDPNSPDKSASSSKTEAQGEYEDWYLGYAKCMRAKGFEVSDAPDPGATITADEGYEAASKSCTDELGDAPAQQSNDEKADRDSILALAKCFRDAGYDLADPKPGMGITLPSDAPKELVDKCLEASE